MIPLCKFESLGGKCFSKECDGQHYREYGNVDPKFVFENYMRYLNDEQKQLIYKKITDQNPCNLQEVVHEIKNIVSSSSNNLHYILPNTLPSLSC